MINDIAIYELEVNEISELKALFSKNGPFVSERRLSDYWLYARMFSSTCIVAKHNGALIGAALAFQGQSNKEEIYIQDVVVSKEYQGKGIGSILINELITRAKSMAVENIWLTTDAKNEQAIKLWEKYGFKNLKADHIKDGYWVTRDLKGPSRDRVVFTLYIRSKISA